MEAKGVICKLGSQPVCGLLHHSDFNSVVAKSGDQHDGLLTIRSRVRSDLEALKEFVPSLGPITESEETDYRYRAKAKAKDVAIGFGSMIENIDYSNFKDKVAEAQGDFRAVVYGEVWNSLYELQANEAAA
jgi:hypothetical protein